VILHSNGLTMARRPTKKHRGASCCAVKEMIIRQNDILKERNLYLSDFKFRSMAQARKEQVEAVLRTAHLILGECGFTQKWFKEWEQSLNYEVEKIEHNGAKAHYVHRVEIREESSRVLITHMQLCLQGFLQNPILS
jgi:hypothetical protein